MVTLGNGKGGRPTIGDDVKIYTGATVFGGIHIGNQVTIGAGAVVSRMCLMVVRLWEIQQE